MRFLAAASLVGVWLAGCSTASVDHCAGRDGDLLFVSAEPPTNEEALFFLIEIYRDGTEEEEQHVPASGCVAFEPEETGQHTVSVVYWIAGADCAYFAEEAVDWQGQRTTVRFEEYRYECEL